MTGESGFVCPKTLSKQLQPVLPFLGKGAGFDSGVVFVQHGYGQVKRITRKITS